MSEIFSVSCLSVPKIQGLKVWTVFRNVGPVMVFLTRSPNSTDLASHALVVRALSQEGKTGAQVLPLPDKLKHNSLAFQKLCNYSGSERAH